MYIPSITASLLHNLHVLIAKMICIHLFFNMQLLEWTFDWKYMVRGLVLDKKRGNILKVSLFYCHCFGF